MALATTSVLNPNLDPLLPLGDDRYRRFTQRLESAHRHNDMFLSVIVYASELVRADFERRLTQAAEKQGLRPERILIQDLGDADIPAKLRDNPQRADTLFFVSGFKSAAPFSFRALNLRREVFFDYKLRAVLWVTQSEAESMKRLAPDFWQVPMPKIQLLDEPASTQVQAMDLADEEFCWPVLSFNVETLTNRQMLMREIKWRLALLKGLEKYSQRTSYERAQQSYLLGQSYWVAQNYGLANDWLGNAYRLAEQLTGDVQNTDPMSAIAKRFLAAVLCGRGNLAISQGYLKLAEEYFGEVVGRFNDPAGLLGLAHISRVRRQVNQVGDLYQSVLAQADASTQRDLIWRAYYGLAQIQFASRNLEAAIHLFEQAGQIGLSKLPDLGSARARTELSRFSEAELLYRQLEESMYRRVARRERQQLPREARSYAYSARHYDPQK